MSRVWASVLVVLPLLPAAASADLDPEVKKPYDLRVALRVAPHRVLTSVFKDKLQRDLHDILQGALGVMAEVRIVDLNNPKIVESDPLLARVASKGLQDGLDGPQPVQPRKTHFVFVDFVDGRYVIEARQHDGYTGLSSSPVQRVWTGDRLLVARSAALLISRDFGLVGTVESIDGARVRLQIKGGALGVPLQPWIKKAEVFAVAAIYREGAVPPSVRLQWTLLRALEEPKGAVCTCQFFSRYTFDGRPLRVEPPIVGYRCLKLGTESGPLRLRFVQEEDRTAPLGSLQVKVSATGFETKSQEEGATTPDGRMDLKEAYTHAAFVRVLNSSGGVVAQLPIEILGDRGVVICPVRVTREGEQRGELENRRRRWIQRLNENLQEESALRNELSAKGEQARKEAMARARAGIETLRAALEIGEQERAQLKQAAEAANAPLDLKDGEQRLAELRIRRDQLEDYVKGLEEIEKSEADPKKKEWRGKALRAKQLEEQADFGQAIDLYKELLREGADDPKLKEHLKQLEDKWQVKNDDQARARKFVYDTWAKLADPEAMKEKLGDLTQAVNACKNAADFLTLQKVLLTCSEHIRKLQKLSDTLTNTNDDDLRRLETIAQVVKQLDEVIKSTADYLKEVRGSGK
jgi:hypothetical protein